MFLENVVVDSIDPQALGRFWEAALGTETLTDEHEGFETRLTVPDGPVLDLCFQRVPDSLVGRPQRLRLDLRGGEEQQAVVERLLSLGASPTDIGQGQVLAGRELNPEWGDLPWRVFTDPSDNEFCVLPSPS